MFYVTKELMCDSLLLPLDVSWVEINEAVKLRLEGKPPRSMIQAAHSAAIQNPPQTAI